VSDGGSPATPRPGVTTALRFLTAARAQTDLRERVGELDPAAGLEPLLHMARDHGYVFTAADLRRAFAHDWGFRRVRYLREPAPADSAASTVAVVNNPASSRQETVSCGDPSGSTALGAGIRIRADGSHRPSSS
jgi:hypothetical protein